MFRAFVGVFIFFAIFFTFVCESFADGGVCFEASKVPSFGRENVTGEGRSTLAIASISNSVMQNTKEFDMEVSQVISETTTVASFIKQAGGEKDADVLLKRRDIVREKQLARDRTKLLIALQSLRAEVLRRHAYLNFALAGLVERQNTEKEIRALQFINRAEYLLKSIEKRINSILGDR